MNDTSSVLTYLHSMYNSLTKSEKKVADFVLGHSKDVIYMTISDISGKAGVGDTTVLRLCKKVGFSSYQDFKLALAQELSTKRDNADMEDYKIRREDSLETLSKKVVGYDIQVIHETLSLLDIHALEKAKNSLIKANRIELYGVGASAITCQDVSLKLKRVGLNAISYSEFHTQMMSASLLGKEDLAIGVSFSGSSKDTNQILSIAKKTGATVLCVTHHANSPITKIADITLLHGGREDPLRGGNLSSKIAQVALFDILYNVVYRDIKKDVLESANKTSKAIVETML